MRFRLVSLLLVLGLAAPTSAQLENVGNLSFPTSASPEAQRHFLRAVAILHSFGWKQAIAEFKLAQKAQPDFALAYWGETLCYNHPLNAEQDAKNPREILARLIPLYRRAAASGQAEISSSPYAHPILPLLCDTHAAREALPDLQLPARLRADRWALAQVGNGMTEREVRFIVGRPPL